MPTPQYFARSLEFPPNLSVAKIPTVSLKLLQASDINESNKLYEACCEHGFFGLNLTQTAGGEALLRDAEHMFELTSSTLNLNKDILERYPFNISKGLLGYKRSGLLKTDDGKMDDMEIYTLGQDDILGNAKPRENPEPIEAKRDACRDFFQHAYDVVTVVLSHLNKHLGLAPGTLEGLCPLEKVSETSLRFLQSAPKENAVEERNIIMGGHTDIGIITVLFHVAGGLQILPAGTESKFENWKYIKPQPNCALINIGDTLIEWTGGLLRSSLHRVVTPAGEQSLVTRQSLAYLVRPEMEASMQRLRSSMIPELGEGEEEETRSTVEWASWRAKQIMNGELKPQTRGGKTVVSAQ